MNEGISQRWQYIVFYLFVSFTKKKILGLFVATSCRYNLGAMETVVSPSKPNAFSYQCIVGSTLPRSTTV